MKQISIYFFVLFCLLASILYLPTSISADPQSTTYELKQYGFGSGGEASTSSTTYSMFGTAGEVDMGTSESTTYRTNPGLIYTIQSAVPPAPSFTNPGNNYDRLKIVINTGGNPTDTTYAIAITSNNWTTTQYVKSTYTIGNTLTSSDWLPYSGGNSWGGSGGFYVTGLGNNTIYIIKVKAKQGNFTETQWGPSSTNNTVDPSLTFGINTASIIFNNLNGGNSYTDSSQSTVLTTSTNAYNGYVVYAHETQPLTYSSSTISDYASPNSAPTTWNGNGFGYTTSCTNLVGGTANRFNNATNYAGFVQSIPGDPVASHSGPVLSSISNETFTISYRITAPNTNPAGTYNNVVNYVVVPSY